MLRFLRLLLKHKKYIKYIIKCFLIISFYAASAKSVGCSPPPTSLLREPKIASCRNLSRITGRSPVLPRRVAYPRCLTSAPPPVHPNFGLSLPTQSTPGSTTCSASSYPHSSVSATTFVSSFQSLTPWLMR